MAQKVSVVLVDDLDGSEATETVSFSLDGNSYEIDLNEAHAAELRDAFATWVGSARRTARSGARRSAAPARRSAGTDRERTQEIRDWARSNGHKVSERGRLSSMVIAAYEAAH
jgi:hypothetical protein